MHRTVHYVLASVTGIDRNELVQLVRTEILTSVEKACWVFRNVIESSQIDQELMNPRTRVNCN